MQRKTFLVFDYETSGVGECKGVPYSEEECPLPRANYPVQVAAQYMEFLDGEFKLLGKETHLIQGVKRFDPWVQKNCSFLSVKECERDGLTFRESLKKLAGMISENDSCTLVAHNIQYDWKEVIVKTVKELDMESDFSFQCLKNCEQFCTCVNDIHKQQGTSYYYGKIGKWIGPNLKKLCQTYKVDYDENKAHEAMYDVDVTRQCFEKGFSFLFR